MSGSNTPSSNRSYSDMEVSQLMNDGQKHFKKVLQTFKVAQLDQLLKAKGNTCKGRKEDKAMQVAWTYTPQEIEAWQAAQNPITLPAIMTQTSILDFAQQG